MSLFDVFSTSSVLCGSAYFKNPPLLQKPRLPRHQVLARFGLTLSLEIGGPAPGSGSGPQRRTGSPPRPHNSCAAAAAAAAASAPVPSGSTIFTPA